MTIFGWHFVGKKLRDGSPILNDNVWLPKVTLIALCERGYHGSKHPFDALRYAPGSTLCYCEYKGAMVVDTDKFVAEQRRIITRMDATELMRYFARMQAISVAHLWSPPDVVLDWLMGDENLHAAAHAAAQAAANAAAHAAALAAATSAALAARAALAAADAALATALATALANALANAHAAATSAALAAQATAWDAALDAAQADFASLVYECFGLEEIK